MHVVIAGSSGLIGTALKESLRADGHQVTALVRREARNDDESQWDPKSGVIDSELLAEADVVVNLAGASIGSKRLTADYAKIVQSSRVDSTTLIATAMAGRSKGKLIQGSAMGFYGHRPDEVLAERSEPGSTTLSGIVQAWEAAAQPAVDAGVPVTFIRTGLVLAAHGGFAERLLPLIRNGLLRRLGDGQSIHSWVTLHDAIRAMRFLMENDYTGAANNVAPNPVSNSTLIRALARAAQEHLGLPVPAFVLRIVVGPAIEDLLSSQHANPAVLSRLGFTWEHPTIDDAATWVIAQQDALKPRNAPSIDD